MPKNNKKGKSKALNKLIDKYLAFVKANERFPSTSDLRSVGITRDAVRHHIGSMTELHKYMKKNYPEKTSIIVDESLFTSKRFKEIKENAKKYKRFVITTAVVERKPHEKFLKSLRSYCKKNNAMLMIIPCQDVASRSRHADWNLNSAFKDDYIIFDDLKLNKNLFISTIKVSAKQINPLTGLSRITQKNGSLVVASTKQFLEFVASSNSKKTPRALMTTGAVTIGDYNTDKYMSQRTSYIAEEDHILGAVVAEVDNNKEFFFRQIQADNKGNFIDLGTMYRPDGRTEKVNPEAIILGDYHSGETDPKVKKVTKEIIKKVKPNNMILHDFFDGKSINHHDIGKPLKKAKKAMNNNLSLKNEISFACREINDLLTWVKGDLIFVKSNHDEVLERYLVEGRYVQDPMNHYYSLELAKKLLDGEDPLMYAIQELEGVKDKSRLEWLERDEEFKIGGVECGAHGDKGTNGSRGSLKSIERAYGNAVVGHSHSAAIYRNVFRVGTSSRLKLDYNSGPSSWTHTHCLIYPNGSRQLINIINGKWKI